MAVTGFAWATHGFRWRAPSSAEMRPRCDTTAVNRASSKRFLGFRPL
jgi:hypothetical protein